MMKEIALSAALAIGLAACSGETGNEAEPPAADAQAGGPDATGETGEAMQADTLTSEDGFTLTPVASDLVFPWDMEFLPNGDMLVTEREGRLRVIRDGELLAEPVTGTPDTLADGQGGYFGLALDPAFAENRTIYLAFAKGSEGDNTTAVIRGVLSEDATELGEVQEIFTGTPRETTLHYGGRLAFLEDGTLIVTLGEGFRYMKEAQDPSNYHGTIARINPDGSVPEDNPFADGAEGAPAVWSYGHRNVQGLLWDEDRGILWAHEHGPKGGDELNIVEPGNNYGWPRITYGVNYDGTIITDKTEAPGMEQPVVKWVPSIAPSGMALVESEVWPDWQGDLIIAAMNGPKGQKLVRIDLDEAGAVNGTEDLLADLAIPFRDVEFGPDGTLYAATANMDGVIYKVAKADTP